MIARRVVGPKGQVVIPKKMRDALGLRAGTTVVFELQGSFIILRPEVEPERYVEYFGKTAAKKLDKEIDIKKLKELIEEEILHRIALH